MEHIYQSIEMGSFDGEDREVYRRIITEAPRGSKIVEIGAFTGYSSSYLTVEAFNANKSLEIFIVDHWMGSPEQHSPEMAAIHFWDDDNHLYNIFLNNMKPLDGHFKAIRKPSVEAAKDFKDGSLWSAYIDAGHTKQDVIDDISAWLPKVKKGGILAGHDYDMSGVVEGIDYMHLNLEYTLGRSWVYRVR